jgi:cytochrome b pre-mRNA-processing protein 3
MSEKTPESEPALEARPARALRGALRDPNIRKKLNGASTRPVGSLAPVSFLARIFGPPRDRLALLPLYEAVVARGRDPAWYREGGVPDTLEGRFDMVTAVLAFVLLRLDREGEAAAGEAARLTEIFIEDMDGTIRELGFGDIVVGKKVGKLLGALGGRMGSFRDALAGSEPLDAAVARNVFRGAPPSEAALAFVSERLGAFHRDLAAASLQDILGGRLG